jgi:hypothetical protein
VFEKCRSGELFITLLGCARSQALEIALYVEPRSAALPTQAFTFEKLRGAIHHSHSIMKHNIGGMDATKELIFKDFMNQGII